MNRRQFLFTASAPAFAGQTAALNRSAVGANTAMAGWGLHDAIEALRRLGFPAIEIHPMGIPEPIQGKFPGFEFDRIPESEKRRIRRSLEGVQRITTHLPYFGLSLFDRDRKVSAASTLTFRIALDATAFFRAELAVMHVSAPKGWTLDEAWPSMVRQLREWGDAAARGRFKLAVETGFPASVAEFVRLIKEVDHEAVGCTIDVGHQGRYKELLERVKPEDRVTQAGRLAYNDITHALIDGLGSKILHLHVHDIDPQTWQEHRPLGTGFVDYPRLIAKLRHIGYRGLLVLEIAGPGDQIEAMLKDSKRKLEACL